MSSDPCGNLNIIVNSTLSVLWSSLPSPYPKFPGTAAAYLRPDGQSVLPWVLTLIILVVHIPFVVLRVVRWELAQTWCFVFTGFTIIIFIQAYVSTAFGPGDVLVWTPLLLTIDAGSMSQMFFLINEDIHLRPWAIRTCKKLAESVTGKKTPLPLANAMVPMLPLQGPKIEGQAPTAQATGSSSSLQGADAQGQAPTAQTIDSSSSLQEANIPGQAAQTTSSSPLLQKSNLEAQAPTAPEQTGKKPATDTKTYFIAGFSSILAIIFFIAILVLQILGLVYAIHASHATEPPPVRWCSPLFQPFGIAVRDGNCNIHPIDQSFNKGIGCITLPGMRQAGWITGTIWGVSISLIVEIGDILILSLTHKNEHFRGVKLRRPFCTIIAGFVVLAVMLFFGILYSRGLPEGITSSIWVVVQVEGQLTVYYGDLTGAGMRGEVIGWNDALFKSWGEWYFGSAVV